MRARQALPALALMTAATIAPAARAATTVHRYAGADRYETSIAIAELLHPDGASTAVVATGTGYPDALAAGVAAAALDAPLLLASAERVPIDTLLALGVGHVLLIGGTAALPESVADELEEDAGVEVERIAGVDRYETAAAVAARVTTEPTASIEAPGDSFATALVGAAHASRIGARLLLVDDLPADAIVIDGQTVRGDPGELNLELLARFVPASVGAVVTTVDAFPDALSAAAVSGASGAIVLFTTSVSATQAAIDALALAGDGDVLVVGGTAAVPEVVLQQLFGYVPLPPEVGPDAEAAIAYDLFVRVNAEREARGAAPLAWDASLAGEAAAWAREMRRTGYRHATLNPNIGENIHRLLGRCDAGACTLPTSGQLHRDWMASADNRDNVVEPGYAIGGVGVFCAPDGVLWAVERFGVGYGELSSGGSPPEPVARADTGGFDCTGAHG